MSKKVFQQAAANKNAAKDYRGTAQNDY